MKRLLYLFTILLLFIVQIKAQNINQNTMSSKNSTSTTLDSNAVYTGTVELLRGYNSLSVTVRSDKSSATNGLKILFGKTSTITTANAVKTYSFSYTANDTLFTKTVGVDAPYYKVVYTTGDDSQTVFLLTTMLNAGDVLPRTSAGKVDVAGSVTGAVTVSGGSSGELLTTPYLPKVTALDSLARTGGAHVDSAIWNPNSKYVACYVVITGRTDKADTLSIKTKSVATRNVWSIYANGLRDVYSTYPEADNQTIIVAANTIRRFLITVPRPEYVLVIRKATNGVNGLLTVKIAFEGVNF